jgi:flavin-dependent dehydrogenase
VKAYGPAEIAVIGAGPAGCVFATRMAQLGFDVCLVEREGFPRRHLGESLTPGVMPMVASMGAAMAVEAAGFHRVAEVWTNWEGPPSVRRDPRGEGRLVDRAAFDEGLLSYAKLAGVRVLQPARVLDHVRTPEGWRLRVDASGEVMELQATFVADASGRATQFGGQRSVMGPRTLAIYGYWTGEKLPCQPCIEAGERAWYWGVPIPGGLYNTLVFVDVEHFRGEPDRALTRGRLAHQLRGLLDRSTLRQGLQRATLASPPGATDATPYLYQDCVSEQHIRIGDAALALDPLSSSGVQKAIQSALSGAIVANTILRRPEVSRHAVEFFTNSLRETAARHRAWASGYYATVAARHPDPFWTSRAGQADPAVREPVAGALPSNFRIDEAAPLRLSMACQWAEVPCLGEQFVEVKTALRHPLLDGPVAYLAGFELAPLLRGIGAGQTPGQLAHAWSHSVPIESGHRLVHWLLRHGVLERTCSPP